MRVPETVCYRIVIPLVQIAFCFLKEEHVYTQSSGFQKLQRWLDDINADWAFN
jgi:hypothetical protein